MGVPTAIRRDADLARPVRMRKQGTKSHPSYGIMVPRVLVVENPRLLDCDFLAELTDEGILFRAVAVAAPLPAGEFRAVLNGAVIDCQ